MVGKKENYLYIYSFIHSFIHSFIYLFEGNVAKVNDDEYSQHEESNTKTNIYLAVGCTGCIVTTPVFSIHSLFCNVERRSLIVSCSEHLLPAASCLHLTMH
ncbi:RING finger protein 122 [Platysternon megacephalum]|uniref:RING finger protein 122 n=1 Tax=Platysternon megacephalum TaxID=55544 RepID=A0A4D9EST1_9SAUR|nr:RING finger protein 122 [Platysternon megacephalum]